VILTGHYGHNQQIVVRETAARMTERLQIPVLGTPEYWLAHDEGYLGEHAGIGETSLLWHLRPELVNIARIRQDPEYGATDAIERGSSPELGKRYADTIISRLAAVAKAMPTWDASNRAAFVRAERALVTAQVTGWRNVHPWASWGALIDQKLTGYGAALAARDFAEIERIAARITPEN
jgi:creatinine amidohydrolase